MSLNQTLKGFATGMECFFTTPGRTEGAPPGKAARGGGTDVPVDEVQVQWIKNGMAAAFTAFGEAVDARVEVVEGAVAVHTEQLSNLEAKVIELEEKLRAIKKSVGNMSSIQELRDSLTAVREEQQKLNSSVPSVAAPASPPGIRPNSSSTLGKIPFEHRVVARIGNLGWDDTEEVILKRVKEILTKAGVTESMRA